MPANTATDNALPADYKLGEYTIKSVLGHGGFGITYLARDTNLGSLVAIKEYFPQAFADRDSTATIHPRTGETSDDAEVYRWGLQEFLKEAQALAKFKHNYIVRVLRYLEANGTAYMIMEYEDGESLNGYLRRHGGFINESDLLRVFLPILTGLQAVHNAGLLHLDIKPDNIYLRANGHPMLIDFGSARQRQSKAETGEKIALTRGYSALEQYPGYGAPGPSTDIYSIGATLYRCITGKEPVDALERHKTIGIGKIDPLAPATKFDRPLYSPYIRECVDLALRLTPEDRPPSALALQNGLMGKEIKEEKSIPLMALGRGSGFIGVAQTIATHNRRQPTPRSSMEKLFWYVLFVVTMTIVVTKIMLDTERLTEVELYQQLDRVHALPITLGQDIKRLIDEHVTGVKSPTEIAPSPVVRRREPVTKPAEQKPIAPFDTTKTIAVTLAAHSPVMALAFLRAGAVLAAAYDDGAVNLWSAETGELMHTLASSAESPGAMAASPDGRWLALSADPNAIQIYDAQENKSVEKLSGHSAAVKRLAFSTDGKRLASADKDQGVILWDTESRKKIFDLPKAKNEVLALTFSPNGRVLAAADSGGGVQYWEIVSGKELAYAVAQNQSVNALAYSPDGKWLASGGENRFLKLWNAGVGRNDRDLTGAPESVHALLFTPDSRWLLLGGAAETVQMWDAEKGELVHRLTGHDHHVYTLALSADGAHLASAGDDGKIIIWK